MLSAFPVASRDDYRQFGNDRNVDAPGAANPHCDGVMMKGEQWLGSYAIRFCGLPGNPAAHSARQFWLFRMNVLLG